LVPGQILYRQVFVVQNKETSGHHLSNYRLLWSLLLLVKTGNNFVFDRSEYIAHVKKGDHEKS